jgi:hypothetical protein
VIRDQGAYGEGTCPARRAKLSSRSGVIRSHFVARSRLAAAVAQLGDGPDITGAVASTSAGPSVSTAAWVSCSPSMMDSASHGCARTLPSRAALPSVGSQNASANIENSVGAACGRPSGRVEEASAYVPRVRSAGMPCVPPWPG